MARARYLLLTTRNVTLSTTNPDLSPHGMVLSAGFRSSVDPEQPPLEFYSWSFPDTRHVENLEMSRSDVEITVCKSFSSGNALSVRGQMEQLPFEEINEWLPVLNSLRRMFRLNERDLEDFDPSRTAYPKALFHTTITEASVSTQRCFEGQQTGDVPAPLDLDWLRGFESDKWRWRWLREIAAAAVHRVSNTKP